MKRKIIIGIVVAALFVAAGIFAVVYHATGGFRYSSSFVTTTCITNSNSKSASMSFGSLKGQKVFRLKFDGHAGGTISYSGKLDSGSLTVYYDNDGTRKELFTLKAGETVDATGGELTEKGAVFIIVKTDGKCEDGKLEFKIK